MAQFDLAKYDTVESRIQKFWDDHENGRILTRMLSDPNALDEVVVQAEIYADRDDPRPVATGLAFEKRGTSGRDGANLTSHLENCETSAIGRAFANWIFKAKKDSPRPSREEMRKVNNGHYGEPLPQPQPQRAPTRQEAAVGAFAPVGGGSNGGPRVNNEPGLCPVCHAPQGKMHLPTCDVI